MISKRIIFCLAIIVSITFLSCTPENSKSSSSVDKKVDSLLSIMTLDEKIGQMNQYTGFWDVTGPAPENGNAAEKYKHLAEGKVGSMLNIHGTENVRAVQKVAVEQSRLGIPLILGYDVIHGYKTMAPIPIAEAASWDLEAIKNSAGYAAMEAGAAGINWTFAPMVDISREPRWGRVMEGAGEDPYLGSLIAAARVQGFQGDDLSSPNTIAACAKHFAAYGFVEGGRDYNTIDIGTSTLYNTVLPPFKAAADAGVKTFMNGFTELNGVPVTANSYLQRDILKEEWGFEGFIISDWDSMGELVMHGFAKDDKDAAYLSVKAGSDMDMQSFVYRDYLKKLIDEGKVDESLVDDAVARILKVKYELGLFDDPYRYCDSTRAKEIIGSKEIMDGVLDVAKKSIVLLKNENQLLPLKKSGMNIAVIGDLADDKSSPLGSWRLAADNGTAVSVIEGLNAYKGSKVSYTSGPKLFNGNTHFVREVDVNTTDRSGFNEAVRAARNKDVVIMVLGEEGFQSGEARNSSSLQLPGLQQELLEAVYKVNKNIVLVLMNGRPLSITWADDHIPAIVEAWQLGTRSGDAIAQVLYGDYNPSGKLPMTFPRSVGQIPLYYNHKMTGRPTLPDPPMVFWSHYQDEVNDPLYVFGHGLSYTTFEYGDLSLSASSLKEGGSIEVSFQLKNTGNYEGREVVQFYIRDMVGSITRPIKELKGFDLVNLKPGESKKVSFTINDETLQFYNNQGKLVMEPGDFKVFVGGSSKTSLEADFVLED